MKKMTRFLQITCFFCISILIYALSINSFMLGTYSKRITDTPQENFDCILILGCGVKKDGTPSDMLMDRILTGVELYRDGVAPVIIMSGDHGRKDYDEVNTMKSIAVSLGVPAEKIFLDHAGFSTYESMYRAKEIFSVNSAAIVTQEYHLYRAMHDAETFDINTVGVPADKHVYYGQTARDFREIIARNKDYIFCAIKPKPKYLGNKISLSSDGNITNG